MRVYKDEGIWPQYLGSYHMLHRIDGHLFAVGVLDYLPETVESVYFFYDPDYCALSPGTLGALREIEYLRQIKTFGLSDTLKYYNMGFIAVQCAKTAYKSNYKP